MSAETSNPVAGPWLTSLEAADYLRYRGKHRIRSLYRFLARQGIPTARRERTLLIARRDLDRAIGAGHTSPRLRRADVA